MDRASLDELREELATLEATETRISAERRRLHNQIDYGFATAETLAREREVSDERRHLHKRIDALRELLQARGSPTGSDKEPAAPDSSLSALGQWLGISPELVAIDDASAEQSEL
jgi:chromosome segregation ATPase